MGTVIYLINLAQFEYVFNIEFVSFCEKFIIITQNISFYNIDLIKKGHPLPIETVLFPHIKLYFVYF